MRPQGKRSRLIFALLSLVALAAIFATAGGREGDQGALGDPDAVQAPAPAQITSSKTSPDAYFKAEAQAQQLQSDGPALAWSSVGRGPINGGYGPSDTLPPFSGRGTSIAVSAKVQYDHTAYLGTSDGGVWKTTDDGQTWNPVFDQEPTLAIGAVAVDPTNPDIVYVGTGEANWQLQGGQNLLGDGIYRSSDGGTTWTRSGIPFASGYMGGGCGVESLAVDRDHTNILLAAVFCPGTSNPSTTAIIRSTDGGASWSGVGPAVGANEDQTPMLTEDPSNAATFYATIAATGGLAGVWKSTDSGATWTQLHLPDLVPSPQEDTAPRGVVAVAPTDGNRLYALFEATYACPASGQGSCLDCPAGACDPVKDPQLWTSADGGLTWTKFANTDATYNHPAAYWFCSSNTCSSTLTMAVSPLNPLKVYVGSIFARSFTVTGAQDDQTDCTYYCTSAAPIHADDRAYVFDSQNRLWVANDGGVYRFDHESDYDSSADNLNATLPTIQIYKLAVGADGKILIATQDQGCDLYDPNTHTWTQWAWGPSVVGCGDSTAAVISSVTPGAMYAGTQFNGWIVRTVDGGQTWDHINTSNLGNAAPFMDPLAEEPVTGALLTGFDGKVWRLANPDTTPGFASDTPWTPISPQFPWYPGAIADANGQTIYVGSSAYSNTTNQMGIEYTHDGGTTWSASSGCCAFAPVTDIEVDPSHPDHAYATTSSWPPQAPRDGLTQGNATSQVYETTDGGATWHTITGDLPAAPYNAIAVDWSFSKQTIYVATDVGVFWSEDDGAIWHATSTGLPTVAVEDLQIQTVDGMQQLYAATFGRGVYVVPTLSSVLQTLTTSTTGGGSGTVTSSPNGIDCGSTCAYDFSDGTTVTLTADASPGSTFTGWSGDCSGTATTCQLMMTGSHSANATFVLNQQLTVARQGDGSGTVTSDPGGLSCGSTCTKDFAPGTQVTLTATADPGSTFTGWSGDCSGVATTCQVPMNATHTVTATFRANPDLTVTTAGTGSGTVTSDPAGISCGATCSSAFAFGATVTLTAAAADGSTFAGWSGDCSGAATTCQLSIGAARGATATFTANPSPPPVKCHVPKLMGKTLAAARTALHKAHCTLGKVTKRASRKKRGVVIRQSPATGASKPEGSVVNVTVSKGSRK